MIPISQFHGVGGAVIVSMIAFTIVFVVLAGLTVMIYAIRYFAMFTEKKDTRVETASAVAVSAPATVSEPVSPTVDSGAKDMKKVVAVISAAINAHTGKSMNIVSVTPAQGNCSNMNQMWRAAGIADCMARRFGGGGGSSGSRS